MIRVKKNTSNELVGVLRTNTSKSLMKTSEMAVQLAMANVNGMLFRDSDKK